MQQDRKVSCNVTDYHTLHLGTDAFQKLRMYEISKKLLGTFFPWRSKHLLGILKWKLFVCQAYTGLFWFPSKNCSWSSSYWLKIPTFSLFNNLESLCFQCGVSFHLYNVLFLCACGMCVCALGGGCYNFLLKNLLLVQNVTVRQVFLIQMNWSA